MIKEQLLNKEKKLAVIGLGYVGLPVAIAFAKHCSVIGFDLNEQRIAELQQHEDRNHEIAKEEFDNCEIIFTTDKDKLKEASFFIAAVPTPVDEHKIPDLFLLKKACETIGVVIQKNSYIVFESTVYPGCTEEECIPIIEKISGLQAGNDFLFGYSPERINPGDKEHSLASVVKIVSGNNDEALQAIADVYSIVVKAGVHKASNIKVAEAAKVIENAQRDLNIAFVNELSLIFDKIGVNTYEVLEAAKTKWNFLPFTPGLVGGHCIGVDPYYLTYKAAKLGYNANVLLAGRHINDNMGRYAGEKILQHILLHNGNVKQAKVLVLGASFKENVADARNSKVIDMVSLLQSYKITVDVHDPVVSAAEIKKEYGIELKNEIDDNYDAVIIAVPHKAFRQLAEEYFCSITKPHGLIADLKGLYRGKIKERQYWSF